MFPLKNLAPKELKIDHQDTGPSDGHQGEMLYYFL